MGKWSSECLLKSGNFNNYNPHFEMKILTTTCPLFVFLINLTLSLPKAITNINQNQNKFKKIEIFVVKREFKQLHTKVPLINNTTRKYCLVASIWIVTF